MQPSSEDEGMRSYILAYPDSFVKYNSIKEAEVALELFAKAGLIVHELSVADVSKAHE